MFSVTLVIVLIISLIKTIGGQYGEPFIGAIGQFSYDCRQTDPDVITSPNNREFEILSGKAFTYWCQFFVDTRLCQHNPQSSGCNGIEIVWSLPEKLTQLKRDKGNITINDNTSMVANDGYNIYTNVFNITNAGPIHDGHYGWNFNLNFEMRTVFEGSFDIKIIDFLLAGELCKHDDDCQSNKCQDSKCVDKDPEKSFPWLIVGLSVAIVLVLIAIIIIFIIICIRRQKKLSHRYG